MSNFGAAIKKALTDAVEVVVADMIVPDIIDNTPRNLQKYPIKNVDRIDGKPPQRRKNGPYR